LLGGISVVDTSTNTVTATIADSSFPIGLALNSSGSILYAANEAGPVSVIDTASNTVTNTIGVGSGPFALAVANVPVPVPVVTGTSPSSRHVHHGRQPGGDQRRARGCDGTTPDGTSATSTADQFSYVYSFSGFFAPVDNPPTLNQVHAGQAIPMKFSLGGDFGLNIITSGFPTATQVDCGAGVPVGSGTPTSTAGGSGLQFDLRLNDGTDHTADFQFR
jgi:YVTN family beta-propeller protein